MPAKRKPAAKKTAKKPVARKAATKRKVVKKVARAPVRKVAKKPAAKVVKKVVAKKPVAKKLVTTPVLSPYSKSLMMAEFAEHADITKKQVGLVFECMSNLIGRHIKKRGAGRFVLPGLLKIEVKKKPATKARKGTNPFTGEEMMFKAKPARNVVKVRPLKNLKEMAEN